MESPPVQLELLPTPARQEPAALARRLARAAGGPLRIILTHNRVTLLTIRFTRGEVLVRMHEGFLEAPAEAIAALERYLATRRRRDWLELLAFVHALSPTRTSPPAAPTRGEIYDLKEIRDRMNRLFFGGGVRCRIGWGRMPGGRRRGSRSRSVRFGCYDRPSNLILVNRRLDDARVPRQFLEYIVFHEMLHSVVPERRSGSKRLLHPPEFRALERRFPGRAAIDDMARRVLRLR